MREDARVGKRPNLSVQVLEIVRNALKEDPQLCAGGVPSLRISNQVSRLKPENDPVCVVGTSWAFDALPAFYPRPRKSSLPSGTPLWRRIA